MDPYMESLLWVSFVFAILFILLEREKKREIKVYRSEQNQRNFLERRLALLRTFQAWIVGLFTVYLGLVVSYELDPPLEEQLRREQAYLEEVKEEARARRDQEIKDAQTRVKLAKVRAEHARINTQVVPDSTELIQAKAELARLQAAPTYPTTARNGEMSSASSALHPSPGTPVDDQRRLILSGLWLGACFFLQRVFEKLFKDKGYALLTVCAAGFLLAFFTANYFLLGGSVTGGLMGSVGDRTSS